MSATIRISKHEPLFADVPALPEGQDAIQSNDIDADEHGRLYLIDRGGAGMHILEYTG